MDLFEAPVAEAWMRCRICRREEPRRGAHHYYCKECGARVEREKAQRRRAKYELTKRGRNLIITETTPVVTPVVESSRTFKDYLGREFEVVWSGDKMSTTRVKGGLLPSWPSKDHGFTP
jgi:predicted RNA-binding Zn-ribbon protein involved in translation (DUF1610 family)